MKTLKINIKTARYQIHLPVYTELYCILSKTMDKYFKNNIPPLFNNESSVYYTIKHTVRDKVKMLLYDLF